MTNHIRRILLFPILTALLNIPIAASAEVSVRTTLDSVTVEMGDRTMIHVEILNDGEQGQVVGIPQQGQEIQGVEFLEITNTESDLGNGRRQLQYDILLQAFEPQMVTMPRIGYAVGVDTTFAEILTLNVRPVALDSLTTINPIPDNFTVSIESKWYDFVPDWLADFWYWIILGILVIALGVTVFILYKKNGKTLFPRKKVVPPYEQAIINLEKLRNSNLIERGHIKEYYTRLIDILREYLMGRYTIYAMEMTSSQILDAIKQHPEASQAKSDLRQLFRVADFVKFAKVLPPQDDNIRSFNVVKQFVEETRPAIPEEISETDNKDNIEDQKKQ